MSTGSGVTLIMVKFVSLERTLSTRVWWRYTAMDSGALCVMTHLEAPMLPLCADNWDTLLPIAMTTYQCKMPYRTCLYKKTKQIS